MRDEKKEKADREFELRKLQHEQEHADRKIEEQKLMIEWEKQQILLETENREKELVLETEKREKELVLELQIAEAKQKSGGVEPSSSARSKPKLLKFDDHRDDMDAYLER